MSSKKQQKPFMKELLENIERWPYPLENHFKHYLKISLKYNRKNGERKKSVIEMLELAEKITKFTLEIVLAALSNLPNPPPGLRTILLRKSGQLLLKLPNSDSANPLNSIAFYDAKSALCHLLNLTKNLQPENIPLIVSDVINSMEMIIPERSDHLGRPIIPTPERKGEVLHFPPNPSYSMVLDQIICAHDRNVRITANYGNETEYGKWKGLILDCVRGPWKIWERYHLSVKIAPKTAIEICDKWNQREQAFLSKNHPFRRLRYLEPFLWGPFGPEQSGWNDREENSIFPEIPEIDFICLFPFMRFEKLASTGHTSQFYLVRTFGSRAEEAHCISPGLNYEEELGKIDIEDVILLPVANLINYWQQWYDPARWESMEDWCPTYLSTFAERCPEPLRVLFNSRIKSIIQKNKKKRNELSQAISSLCDFIAEVIKLTADGLLAILAARSDMIGTLRKLVVCDSNEIVHYAPAKKNWDDLAFEDDLHLIMDLLDSLDRTLNRNPPKKLLSHFVYSVQKAFISTLQDIGVEPEDVPLITPNALSHFHKESTVRELLEYLASIHRNRNEEHLNHFVTHYQLWERLFIKLILGPFRFWERYHLSVKSSRKLINQFEGKTMEPKPIYFGHPLERLRQFDVVLWGPFGVLDPGWDNWTGIMGLPPVDQYIDIIGLFPFVLFTINDRGAVIIGRYQNKRRNGCCRYLRYEYHDKDVHYWVRDDAIPIADESIQRFWREWSDVKEPLGYLMDPHRVEDARARVQHAGEPVTYELNADNLPTGESCDLCSCLVNLREGNKPANVRLINSSRKTIIEVKEPIENNSGATGCVFHVTIDTENPDIRQRLQHVTDEVGEKPSLVSKFCRSQQFYWRFLEECQVMNDMLKDTGIVTPVEAAQVIGVGGDQPMPFYVMPEAAWTLASRTGRVRQELSEPVLSGTPMEFSVKPPVNLNEKQSNQATANLAFLLFVLRSINDVTTTLSELHNRKPLRVIHRDIKPQNILLFHNRAIQIADFGIHSLDGLDQRTLDTKYIGTPPFSAPELKDNPGGPQSRAPTVDVYALGVMIVYLLFLEDSSHTLPMDYEKKLRSIDNMVLSELPFNASDLPIIGDEEGARRHPALSSPSRANSKIRLYEIVKQCLNKYPEARYQDASELAACLEKYERLVQSAMLFRVKKQVDRLRSGDDPRVREDLVRLLLHNGGQTTGCYYSPREEPCIFSKDDDPSSLSELDVIDGIPEEHLRYDQYISGLEIMVAMLQRCPWLIYSCDRCYERGPRGYLKRLLLRKEVPEKLSYKIDNEKNGSESPQDFVEDRQDDSLTSCLEILFL